MHQVLDNLVEDECNARLVNFFEVLFVFTHCEFLELLWILDDRVDCLELLVLLNVRLVLVKAISDELVDMVIVSQMDPCLVQDVGLHVVRSLLWLHSDLGETQA